MAIDTGVLASLSCHYFGPDDAVVEWEIHLLSLEQLYKREWPRYVTPILNNCIGVCVVSDGLTIALAVAAPSELHQLAARSSSLNAATARTSPKRRHASAVENPAAPARASC